MEDKRIVADKLDISVGLTLLLGTLLVVCKKMEHNSFIKLLGVLFLVSLVDTTIKIIQRSRHCKVIVWTVFFIVSVIVAHIAILCIVMGLRILLPASVADNMWFLLIPLAANIAIHSLLHAKMRKLPDNQDKMMNDFAEAWLWAGVGVIPIIYIGANYLKLFTLPAWVTSYWTLIPLAIIVFSSLVRVGLEIHTVVQKHEAMVAEAERKEVIEKNKSAPSVQAAVASCKDNHITLTKEQYDASIAALVKVGVFVPIETDGLFEPGLTRKLYISDENIQALIADNDLVSS